MIYNRRFAVLSRSCCQRTSRHTHHLANLTQKNGGKCPASILYRKIYKMPHAIFATIFLFCPRTTLWKGSRDLTKKVSEKSQGVDKKTPSSDRTSGVEREGYRTSRRELAKKYRYRDRTSGFEREGLDKPSRIKQVTAARQNAHIPSSDSFVGRLLPRPTSILPQLRHYLAWTNLVYFRGVARVGSVWKPQLRQYAGRCRKCRKLCFAKNEK